MSKNSRALLLTVTTSRCWSYGYIQPRQERDKWRPSFRGLGYAFGNCLIRESIEKDHQSLQEYTKTFLDDATTHKKKTLQETLVRQVQRLQPWIRLNPRGEQNGKTDGAFQGPKFLLTETSLFPVVSYFMKNHKRTLPWALQWNPLYTIQLHKSVLLLPADMP